MTDAIHYSQVFPSAELTSGQVQRLLEQLSSIPAPRPLVFETWANDGGIVHLLGRGDSGKSTIRSLICSHIPETRMVQAVRPNAPERVAKLKLTPKAMPLREDGFEDILHSLYGVLASRRQGEMLALQVVFGGGRRPSHVPGTIADPSASVAQLLVRGRGTAPTETRRRIAQHASQPRVDVTVRIGVTAASPERRQQMRNRFLSVFAQLEAPSARLSLVGESPSKWQMAGLGRQPIALTAQQLLGLVGWPVDELVLPGMPALHPRLLPPPRRIITASSVFATTTAPGVERSVGLRPNDRLLHLAITGGTNSGKSEIFATLALSDIQAGRPLVLIEPKRQLVDAIIARAQQGAIGKIVVIDAAEKNPVGFNPLDVGGRDPGVVVDGILEVFKNVFAEGWGPRTEDLMLAGLLTLVADGARRNRPHTLLDLPLLISDDGYRRGVIGSVADDPTLAGYWAGFDALTPANRANIVAAPLNKLRKYVLRKNVAAVLGQSRPKLHLRDVFRRGDLAVLVPLNDALIGPGAAQLLGGLVVNEIWLATQERATEKNPQKRPGMVFIDEVQRYLHLPTSIDDALATSRSYGVGWHLAFQGRGQFPTKLADAVELNARNQITFAASPKDAVALAKTSGKLTVEDFQSLARFHIYANLVADGAPAGWFSAKTSPPTEPSGYGKQIRDAYRQRFAGDAAPDDRTPTSGDKQDDASNLPVVRSHQRRRRS